MSRIGMAIVAAATAIIATLGAASAPPSAAHRWAEGALAVSSAAESTPRLQSLPTQWNVPVDFYNGWAAGAPVYAQRFFEHRPPHRFRLYVGTASKVRFRGFNWTRWGARTVTGRGRTKICDAAGCSHWYSSRIVLCKRELGYCGDGPALRVYRAYVVHNFPNLSRAKRGSLPGRC